MNVALIVNQSKEDAESFRKVIVDALEKRGIQPRLFLNKDFLKSDVIDIDCIITWEETERFFTRQECCPGWRRRFWASMRGISGI